MSFYGQQTTSNNLYQELLIFNSRQDELITSDNSKIKWIQIIIMMDGKRYTISLEKRKRGHIFAGMNDIC